MKNLLYTFMALLLLGVTACGDDDDNTTFSTPAQMDAEGSFSGSFVRVQVGTTDTVVADGLLTLSATDTLNRARVSFTSDVMTELVADFTIPVNISHADQGFVFYNKSGDYAVVGRIAHDKTIRTTFTKAVRSGRSTKRYNYEFVGIGN